MFNFYKLRSLREYYRFIDLRRVFDRGTNLWIENLYTCCKNTKITIKREYVSLSFTDWNSSRAANQWKLGMYRIDFHCTNYCPIFQPARKVSTRMRIVTIVVVSKTTFQTSNPPSYYICIRKGGFEIRLSTCKRTHRN